VILLTVLALLFIGALWIIKRIVGWLRAGGKDALFDLARGGIVSWQRTGKGRCLKKKI
jgi:hypothetical protein